MANYTGFPLIDLHPSPADLAAVVLDLLVRHYDPMYTASIQRNFKQYPQAQALVRWLHRSHPRRTPSDPKRSSKGQSVVG